MLDQLVNLPPVLKKQLLFRAGACVLFLLIFALLLANDFDLLLAFPAAGLALWFSWNYRRWEWKAKRQQ